jgi:sterol 3beta-glucosyltransferase
MRIALLTAGSRGDTQPLVVVAAALRDRGHDVVVTMTDDFLPMATSIGLDTVPMGFSARVFLESEDGARLLATGDTRAYAVAMMTWKARYSDLIQAAMLRASEGADLIVSAGILIDEASCIAEATGVPVVAIQAVPRRDNAVYPPPGAAVTVTSAEENLLAHVAAAEAEWQATSAYINAFRATLGLPGATVRVADRLAEHGALEVQVYSAAVVPGLGSWPARMPLVGFLEPTSDQREGWGEAGIAVDLERWLSAGDAPVFFGFGSMPVLDPPAMTAMIQRVCSRLGVRGLIGAGWSGFAQADDDDFRASVRVAGTLNHTEVLPRCVAAIHHGGAGTTAAALFAGIPAVVCSVFFDQPFWGQRVTELGVGSTFPFVELTEQRLVDAIEPLLAPAVTERARRLREELATEDAAAATVDAIERIAFAQ